MTALCACGCGLVAAPGDIFTDTCREAYDRDPSWIMDLQEADFEAREAQAAYDDYWRG